MHRRARRALSLVEVMVASAIFMLASLALLASQRMSAHSASKIDSSSDTYRMAMLSLRRIEEELRGARIGVLNPDKSDEISYKVLEMGSEGRPLVNELDQTSWIPRGAAYYRLRLDAKKNLISTRQPGARLGFLGNAGRLEFSFPNDLETHLIQVKVHAEVTDTSGRALASPYDASVKIYLENHT